MKTHEQVAAVINTAAQTRPVTRPQQDEVDMTGSRRSRASCQSAFATGHFITGLPLLAALALIGPPLVVGCALKPAGVSMQHSGVRTDRAHPPGLNHVYVVLDAKTYAAFRDSPDVAALLGRSDGGLPDYAPPEGDADRIFFRGRHTYLELFAPGNRFNEPVGKVGLGLGYDEPESFASLKRVWRGTCGEEIKRERIEFERVRPPVPWYDAIWCDATANSPGLSVWAMVYLPQFARWQAATETGVSASISRKDVLAARAAAGGGRFDLTGVAIDLPAPLHAKLVAQLAAAGFARTETSAGTRLSGQGWDLLLREVETAPALVSLTMAADAAPQRALPLGLATMVGDAGTVEVRFSRSR